MIAFVLIIFIFFIFFRPKTRADLVYFYPQTCLGSFVNPEKAQGEREVDNPDLINELNSAVYYSGFKEIYCGNFQGPAKEGNIKRITLYFNWLITKELKEKPVIESTSSESFIEKIIPPKTIEINITTSDIPILENTSTEIQNSTETATSSQIFKIINFAFAEEDIQNSTSTTPTSINSELTQTQTESQTQTSTETNLTTLQSTTSTETTTNQKITEESFSTTEEPTSTITLTTAKTLFDIHYTLDGQNWNYLGSVNKDNWQNLTFDIPVNDWLDISKIQIKINSLPDTDYYLYLESMWLEVEYENPQPSSTVNNEQNPNLAVMKPTEEQEGDISEETTKTTTPSETFSQTINEPLKIRKVERKVEIKNVDNILCSMDQFSININEGENKFINLHLSSEGIKNLEIGSLPNGIDVVFVKNNDYQISANDNAIQLKIYRQKGSDKGNFSIPIIFNSKNSTIICQINIITN